jgi:hypothetical protein
MLAEPVHPGKVVFYDADNDRITDEADAESLPFAMKFVETDEGFLPVVRVVMFSRGDQKVIASYGVNGELLHTLIGYTSYSGG